MTSLDAMLRAKPLGALAHAGAAAARRERRSWSASSPPASTSAAKASRSSTGSASSRAGQDGQPVADGKLTTFTGPAGGRLVRRRLAAEGRAAPYDVVALRDSRVALMPRATFDALLDGSIAFNRFLLLQLNERLGQFIGQVEYDRLLDRRGARRALPRRDVQPVPLPGHRAAAADLAGGDRLPSGLSRQRVNQALKALEQAGVLQVGLRRDPGAGPRAAAQFRAGEQSSVRACLDHLTWRRRGKNKHLFVLDPSPHGPPAARAARRQPPAADPRRGGAAFRAQGFRGTSMRDIAARRRACCRARSTTTSRPRKSCWSPCTRKACAASRRAVARGARARRRPVGAARGRLRRAPRRRCSRTATTRRW